MALLTRQRSKGLEFNTVVLSCLGGLKEERLEEEVRLLYVGMTRAKFWFLLAGSGDSWFIEKCHHIENRKPQLHKGKSWSYMPI